VTTFPEVVPDFRDRADLEERTSVVGRIADGNDATRAVSLEHADDDADLAGERPRLSPNLPDGLVRREVSLRCRGRRCRQGEREDTGGQSAGHVEVMRSSMAWAWLRTATDVLR